MPQRGPRGAPATERLNPVWPAWAKAAATTVPAVTVSERPLIERVTSLGMGDLVFCQAGRRIGFGWNVRLAARGQAIDHMIEQAQALVGPQQA